MSQSKSSLYSLCCSHYNVNYSWMYITRVWEGFPPVFLRLLGRFSVVSFSDIDSRGKRGSLGSFPYFSGLWSRLNGAGITSSLVFKGPLPSGCRGPRAFHEVLSGHQHPSFQGLPWPLCLATAASWADTGDPCLPRRRAHSRLHPITRALTPFAGPVPFPQWAQGDHVIFPSPAFRGHLCPSIHSETQPWPLCLPCPQPPVLTCMWFPQAPPLERCTGALPLTALSPGPLPSTPHSLPGLPELPPSRGLLFFESHFKCPSSAGSLLTNQVELGEGRTVKTTAPGQKLTICGLATQAIIFPWPAQGAFQREQVLLITEGQLVDRDCRQQAGPFGGFKCQLWLLPPLYVGDAEAEGSGRGKTATRKSDPRSEVILSHGRLLIYPVVYFN